MPALAERWGGLDFEALERPPGFRRLASDGAVTAAAIDPFVGLTSSAERTVPSCTGLFDVTAMPGIIPVASFPDYDCAYCRVLEPRLDALDGVRITRHELPLLGDGSVLAARVALAAGLQGPYAPFHAALMRTPRPSPDAIVRIATDLDLPRLQTNMDGPAVAEALARTDLVAALLEFYATPSLVVGRTLAIGAIGRATLDRLIARERGDGPVPSCA